MHKAKLARDYRHNTGGINFREKIYCESLTGSDIGNFTALK